MLAARAVERYVSTRRSFSLISTSMFSSISGETKSEANEVSRVPVPKGEMRTRRWTPASAESSP